MSNAGGTGDIVPKGTSGDAQRQGRDKDMDSYRALTRAFRNDDGRRSGRRRGRASLVLLLSAVLMTGLIAFPSQAAIGDFESPAAGTCNGSFTPTQLGTLGKTVNVSAPDANGVITITNVITFDEADKTTGEDLFDCIFTTTSTEDPADITKDEVDLVGSVQVTPLTDHGTSVEITYTAGLAGSGADVIVEEGERICDTAFLHGGGSSDEPGPGQKTSGLVCTQILFPKEGSLKIIKAGADLGTTEFTIHVVCTFEGTEVFNDDVVISGAGSETIGPFPEGTECTATEDEPAGFEEPVITGSPATIVDDQTVEITVTNRKTPPADLELCKELFAGTTELTGADFPFRFDVTVGGQTSLVTVNAGECKTLGTFDPGTQVTIDERPLPVADRLASITVDPASAEVSRNLAAGRVVVEVSGTKVTVTYRNEKKPGELIICKDAGIPAPPAGTEFTFTVTDSAGNTQQVVVKVGECETVSLFAGPATIVENALTGFELVDITVSPADRLISKNVATRTVTVRIRPVGEGFTTTTVRFKNRGPGGGEGCTPGFWKNHPEAWEGYSPSQTLEAVFNNVPNSLDNVTLLQALSFRGGPTLVDAKRILLRHAVAALLNAAHSDVDYPLTTAQVISQTNTALASSSRSTVLNRAAEFDRLNNAVCPL